MPRYRVYLSFLFLLSITLILTDPPPAEAGSKDSSLEIFPISSTDHEAFEPSAPQEVFHGAALAGKTSKGGTRGSRAGKAFTPAGKKEIDAANAAKNGGTNKCENCGTAVVPAERSQSGVTPPSNQRERDHIVPKSKGGEGTASNGQVLCRECNLEKSDKTQ